MKLDRERPFGVIYGHAKAAYEQDGVLFNGAGKPIDEATTKEIEKDKIVETNDVSNAKTFLETVLKNGPLAKPQVLKIAEGANQRWADVTKAASLVDIVKYQYRNSEMWKLPA